MDVQQYQATIAAVDEDSPSGLWAGAPAIAASTVPMVNTSGYQVIVDITAGTVTAVTINGNVYKAQNANVVAGRFRVRRGGTIAITYSVVPTHVAWYYE
jgi:hypothetical protein